MNFDIVHGSPAHYQLFISMGDWLRKKFNYNHSMNQSPVSDWGRSNGSGYAERYVFGEQQWNLAQTSGLAIHHIGRIIDP